MIAVDPGEQGAVARWTADGLAWVLPLDEGFLPAQALAELPGEVLIVELPGFARDKASVSSALYDANPANNLAGASLLVRTTTLSGTVTDSETGAPLGAGGYSISSLPAGTYALTITYAGRQQRTVMATVTPGVVTRAGNVALPLAVS